MPGRDRSRGPDPERRGRRIGVAPGGHTLQPACRGVHQPGLAGSGPRFEDAERHQQGVALAHQIGRPYLEFTGLTHGAHGMPLFRPGASRAEWSRQAIELAERHGWGGESLAGMAYAQLGIGLLCQGRLDEAEPWLERADATLRTEAEPAAGMSLRYARAVLELARGRYQEALAAFRDARKLAGGLAGPHPCVTSMRSRMLQTLVRLGRPDGPGRCSPNWARTSGPAPRCAPRWRRCGWLCDDPEGAADALGPVLDGSVPGVRRVRWYRHCCWRHRPAARWATRPPPDVPWNGRWISPSPAAAAAVLAGSRPGAARAARRDATAHPALTSRILDLLAGRPGPCRRPAASRTGSAAVAWTNSSPIPRPASCATCRPTSRRPRSPLSSGCQ